MSRFNEHYIKLEGSIMVLKNVLTHLRSAQKAIDGYTLWRINTDALYLEPIRNQKFEIQKMITEIDSMLTDFEDRRDAAYEIHELRGKGGVR